MVTNAVKEPEPDRLAEARLAIQASIREAVTGQHNGSVRLYALMGAVGIALLFTPFPINVAGLVAYIALILDGQRPNEK